MLGVCTQVCAHIHRWVADIRCPFFMYLSALFACTHACKKRTADHEGRTGWARGCTHSALHTGPGPAFPQSPTSCQWGLLLLKACLLFTGHMAFINPRIISSLYNYESLLKYGIQIKAGGSQGFSQTSGVPRASHAHGVQGSAHPSVATLALRCPLPAVLLTDK